MSSETSPHDGLPLAAVAQATRVCFCPFAWRCSHPSPPASAARRDLCWLVLGSCQRCVSVASSRLSPSAPVCASSHLHPVFTHVAILGSRFFRLNRNATILCGVGELPNSQLPSLQRASVPAAVPSPQAHVSFRPQSQALFPVISSRRGSLPPTWPILPPKRLGWTSSPKNRTVLSTIPDLGAFLFV